jgi:hypothetical protein
MFKHMIWNAGIFPYHSMEKECKKKQISGSLFCSDEWVNKAGPIFNTPLHLIYCSKLLKKCEKEVHNYNTTHVLIRSFGRLLLSAWSQGMATCYCGFLISSDLSRFPPTTWHKRQEHQGGEEGEGASFFSVGSDWIFRFLYMLRQEAVPRDDVCGEEELKIVVGT